MVVLGMLGGREWQQTLNRSKYAGSCYVFIHGDSDISDGIAGVPVTPLSEEFPMACQLSSQSLGLRLASQDRNVSAF